MKETINKIKSNTIISVFTGSVILYIFLTISNVREFFYDSYEYWAVSSDFFSSGRFAFNPESYNYRGYVLELVLAILNGFGRLKMPMYWLLESIFFAIIICGVIPAIYKLITGKTTNLIQRCATLALLIIFWPGLFRYPLSDMYCVSFSLISLYFVMKLKSEESLLKTGLFALLAGAFSYACVNTRATYQWNMYIILLFIIAMLWKRWPNLGTTLVFFFVGFIILALPQMYANHVNYDTWSYKNPLNFFTPNRFSFVLMEGTLWNRIEGYVGGNPAIPPAFIGQDPTIKFIFDTEGTVFSEVDPPAMKEFISLCLHHPFEVMIAYFSHFINLLDARYGNIYSTDLTPDYSIQILSVLVYYITLADACIRVRCSQVAGKITKSNVWNFVKSNGLILFYVLLPTLTAIPSFVEPRYAISFNVLVYSSAALLVDYKKLWSYVKNHPIVTIVGYALLFFTLTLIQDWSLYIAYYMPVN